MSLLTDMTLIGIRVEFYKMTVEHKVSFVQPDAFRRLGSRVVTEKLYFFAMEAGHMPEHISGDIDNGYFVIAGGFEYRITLQSSKATCLTVDDALDRTLTNVDESEWQFDTPDGVFKSEQNDENGTSHPFVRVPKGLSSKRQRDFV